MLPLNTLFELSKRLRANEGAPVLDDTESPSFDGAWSIYASMAAKNPEFYTAVWRSAAAFALTEGTKPLNIKMVRDASQFVAMSYLAAAHYVAELVQDTAPERLQDELHKEISSKIKFIEAIAGKVTLSLLAQTNPAAAKGEAHSTVLGDDIKLVLGEFYSLSIYALRELRTNAYHSIRLDANDTVLNHAATMRDFGLPLFMNRDERARKEQLGSAVAVFPAHPSLGICMPAANVNSGEEGEKPEGAKVLTFGAIAKRRKGTPRAPE